MKKPTKKENKKAKKNKTRIEKMKSNNKQISKKD